MLDFELIKKINIKNVSVDLEKTKEIIRILLKDITKKQKNRAVEIERFSSSNFFNKTIKQV